MVIIGLTGGLSSGKSTASQMFQNLGARVISADKIVHQLLAPRGKCFKRVVQQFGERIVRSGRINRAKLAQIVFNSSSKRKKLEAIVHPQVRLAIRNKIRQYKRGRRTKVLVLDIPLSFESHWHRQVDYTVVVTATQTQQVNRAVRHLKISRKDALKRMKAQMPLSRKAKLADYVIKNNSTKLNTKKQVTNIYKEILEQT